MTYENKKKLCIIAVLVAIEIILSRFCSIATPVVKIGFGFLPISIIGMLYGPLWGGLAAALADFAGAILFPIGAYFPGFTLTAFLTGFTFGLLLYHRVAWWRILLSVGIVSAVLNLSLDTLWLFMLTGQGYLALLPTRVLKCLIMIPIQVAAIKLVSARICQIYRGTYCAKA